MSKLSFLLTLLLVNLIGCAGSGANPIRVMQINDNDLSCNQIEAEVGYLFSSVNFKMIENKRTKNINIASWIGGQLLLLPMLTMDVKGSAQIERQAIIRRLERLQVLSETCTDS